MIAVALSGGIDSAAAAILLREAGNQICGVLLRFSPGNPDDAHIQRAHSLCDYLGIELHVVDAAQRFAAVKDYFCREYLGGRTPNPCAICNRDIKFGSFIDVARELGAEKIATGHYVRKGSAGGRYFLLPGAWRQSQEYFMALVDQAVLAGCEFPLGELTRPEVEGLVAATGLDLPLNQASQDICFVAAGDYAGFIEDYAGPCRSSRSTSPRRSRARCWM